MILRAIAILAFSVVMASSQSNVTIAPVDPSLTPFVASVTYGTPAFDKTFQSLGGDHNGALAPILPFSLIVHNISQTSIIGTSVEFVALDFSGRTRRYLVTSVDLNSQSTATLQSGTYRFVSIMAPVNQAFYTKNFALLSHLPSPLSSVAAELNGMKQITISIDAIITSAGKFIGPDTGEFYARIQAEQRADQWVATQLLSMPSAQLYPRLQTLAAMNITETGDPFRRDFYDLRVRSTAVQLLERINRGDSAVVNTYGARLQREITVSR